MGEKGYKYICSDIHGRYGSYCDAIRLLGENDHLFILGDVIDRGKNGIKILQDIMKRPNVHLFMGNHEYMMLHSLDIIKKNGVTREEIEALNMKSSLELFDQSQSKEQSIRDNAKKEIERIKNNRERILETYGNYLKLSDEDKSYLNNWTSGSTNGRYANFT